MKTEQEMDALIALAKDAQKDGYPFTVWKEDIDDVVDALKLLREMRYGNPGSQQ